MYMKIINRFQYDSASIQELSEECQRLLKCVTVFFPITRAFDFEQNLHKSPSQRYLKFNQVYIGFEQEGLLYLNRVQSNGKNLKVIPQSCSNGKYDFDPRCSPWYIEGSKGFSVSQVTPFLAEDDAEILIALPICQRMLMFNNTSNQDSLHHVLCFNIFLGSLANYFQNYASSTTQTYVIDPLSQIVVFDSKNRLNNSEFQTLESLEFQYQQNTNQSTLVNQTINQYYNSQPIFTNSINLRIDEDGDYYTTTQQQVQPYEKNNTQQYIVYNSFHIYDKLSQPGNEFNYLLLDDQIEGELEQKELEFLQNFQEQLESPLQVQNSIKTIEQKDQNRKMQQELFYKAESEFNWQKIQSLLMMNFVTEEFFLNQSNIMKQFFKKEAILTAIVLFILAFISAIFTIIYSVRIRNMLLAPIIQLTQILIKIQEEKDSIQIEEFFEDTELDIDETFCSKETKDLYDCLKEIFKIMKFSRENFFKENKMMTLLNLNDYLSFFKQFQNYYAVGIAHNNIGCIFLSSKHYQEALEHFSQAVLYQQYEITQYYEENPNSRCPPTLTQYCFHDIDILLNEVFLSNSANNTRLNVVDKSRTKNTSLNIFKKVVDSRISVENSNHIINRSNEDAHKLLDDNKDVSKQLKVEYKEEKTATKLLTSLYFRKKNYITALIAFQENNEAERKKNYHTTVQFNTWREIKDLLRGLLVIAQNLPLWESQRVEILLMVSQCNFKLNNYEKYFKLMQECEFLIKKLDTYQDLQLFKNQIKETVFSSHKSLLQNKNNYAIITTTQDILNNKQKRISPNNMSLLSESNSHLLLSTTFLNHKSQKCSPKHSNTNYERGSRLNSNCIKTSSYQFCGVESPTYASHYLKKKANQLALESSNCKEVTFKITNTGQDLPDESNKKQEEIYQQKKKQHYKYLYKMQFNFLFTKEALQVQKELIESEFLIHQKNYRSAGLLLTSILENNQNLISILPFYVLKKISEVFQYQSILSREINTQISQYNHNLGFHISLICTETEFIPTNSIFNSTQIGADYVANQNVESIYFQQLELLHNLTDLVLVKPIDRLGVIQINKQSEDSVQIKSLAELLSIEQFKGYSNKQYSQLLYHKNQETSLTNIPINNELKNKINSLKTKLSSHSLRKSKQQEFFKSQQNSINKEYLSKNNPILSQLRMSQSNNNQKLSCLEHQIISNPKEIATKNLNNSNNEAIFSEIDIEENNNNTQQINQVLHSEKEKLFLQNKSSTKSEQSHQNQEGLSLQQQYSFSQNKEMRFFDYSKQAQKEINMDCRRFLKERREDKKEEDSKECNLLNNASKQVESERGDFSNQLLKEDNQNQASTNLIILKKNYSFHMAVRKALNQLTFSNGLKSLLIKQELKEIHTSYESKWSREQNKEIQQFVIYQIDEVVILQNQLFKKLLSVLSSFNIKLLILSHKKKDNNFIELNKQEEQYIKIFYTVKQLIQYLISLRNRLPQSDYLSYLQHF